jgi:polar amino acid transport system substrate-binding protein
MKQVIQDLRTRQLKVADVPPPVVQPGRVLVRTVASLISAGTERMTVEMGKRSLLGKARERPDLVKQVIQKAQQEGVMNTLTAVRAKLGSVTALGYSASGTVIGVGEDVTEFRPGDRVACAGAGYASHAEVLSVPKNLCARLPESVDFESAAFSTLGAIALQGLRLAGPTLGEAFVVIGLGLIGQLTVQLLKANGCRVFGIDPDLRKIELTRELGAEDACDPSGDAQRRVWEWSRGRGADGVLITAATPSNEPITMAGEISRLKGRVVAVGLVGLDVPRDIYYHKELTLNISMSYGPGRYDPEYEERGHDYPLAYVRWTEGRNLEAFLDLVAAGRVNVSPLITHRFSVVEAERAYELITNEAKEPYLGILLRYDPESELENRIGLAGVESGRPSGQSVNVGLIGAGSYAKRYLLPNFKTAGAKFQTVATASGVSAREVGEKYGFRFCVSGTDEVLADQDANLIVIATRHDTHAELARRGLEHGRHVFVEKPLALNDDELELLLEAAAKSDRRLMVGFNRRFSPLALAAKEFFQGAQTPLSINYRVNAGRIPKEHWVQDRRQGGRIIGEVCHFIDLMQYLTGALTTRVFAEATASRSDDIVSEDSVFITLRFADGSNGSIAYLAEGDKAMEKERVEILGDGKTFVLEDFRSATLYGGGKTRRIKLRSQDKGQANEVREVCRVVLEGGPAPIALEDLTATTRATFRIMDSLRTGLPVEV